MIKIMITEDKNDSVHAGHRNRMLKRCITEPNSLLDHELLEIMLFNVIPRANTNTLAHKLLREFGNLYNILNATCEELVEVDGVSLSTARYLLLYGIILNKLNNAKLTAEKFDYKSELVSACHKFGSESFEHVLFVFVDGKSEIVKRVYFSLENKNYVKFDLEFFKRLSLDKKIKKLLVIHNHPDGDLQPSSTDDVSAKKLYDFCKILGVELIDSAIINKTDYFSYKAKRPISKLNRDEKKDVGELFSYTPIPKIGLETLEKENEKLDEYLNGDEYKNEY